MLFYLIHEEHPKQYLIELLESIKLSNSKGIFTKSDLEALFRIFDPANQGHINLSQYKEAMKNLGVGDYTPYPYGSENEKIDMGTFVDEW
jgi:Ca2+-binding EF-hand superfamily protein